MQPVASVPEWSPRAQALIAAASKEPRPTAMTTPDSPGYVPPFNRDIDSASDPLSDKFPETRDYQKSIVIEHKPPYAYCDRCHRRKTGWRIRRDEGDWSRRCFACMSPVEARLVQSITAMNAATGKKLGTIRAGVEK